MMNKTICICIILLSATISVSMGFAIENESNNNKLSVTYSFEKPVVKKVEIGGNIYDQVIMRGSPCIGNKGEPGLPARGADILLPQKTNIEKIKVTTGKRICLGIDYNIMPVVEPVPLSEMNSLSLPVPNEMIYSSGNSYPGKLFTKVGIYSFRGYKILVLMLYPVQYIPNTGELFYYTDITVSIETIETDNVNSLFRGLEQDKQDVIQKVDNPSIVSTYSKEIKSNALDDDYGLLIITTDELKDSFEPLKNAHDADGVSTIIRTLTDIGGSTPENIRDYIRDVYTNLGIEYVLIGGDDNLIKAKDLFVEAMGYKEYNMPSDIYYACLDGTYNYDGDYRWGEPNDGDNGSDVDLIADVYVGRACVGNTLEVNHFVNKTIKYMNVDFDDDYLKDVVMVGEHLGFGGVGDWGGNYMDELINGSSAYGYITVGIPSVEYNIVTLYDRDGLWPKSEIIGYINSGFHIINHLGHGSPDYAMKMYNQDADDLVNDKHCFIYSQTCSAGHFDGTDCFAEHMNVKTYHGAYALVMNARYGFGRSYSTDGPSQRFHREFWDAVFGEEISVVSKANHDSKEDNLWRINEDAMRWCCYELNLFGDPTLDLVPKPPPILDIEIGNITGGLFHIKAEIKNTGDTNATNVHWNITLNGGLVLLGKMSSGTTNISVGKTEEVQSELIFGFGGFLQPIEITVTAEIPESSDTKDADAVVLLFLIRITPK